jgi:DNA repair exonuclease SbcCD ATPase subunit
MNGLDKLNSLLSQIDSRIEQIDENQLTEEKMNVLKEYRNNIGKNKYEVYHDSYTGAVNAALDYAERNGYTYDQEEVATKIGMGNRKPDEGVTNKFTISLFKDGVETKKSLQIQIYGMREKYELNCYIA